MGIFKSYDIRAVYGRDWNRDTARKIGFFLPRLLPGERILVGRDARLSSEEIFEALSDGIRDAGCNVVDAGRCSTPAVYFATAAYDDVSGSVMITASHNPAEYNGLKISRPLAVPVGYDTGLNELEAMMDQPVDPVAERGSLERRDIRADYFAHLKRFIHDTTGIKAVIDCSDGMAGVMIHDVARELSAECILMYDTPDGRFPHHEPNPLVEENLADLKKRVLEERADIGVCFDGDADRAMFVDEQGAFVSPDLVTPLLARHFFRYTDSPAKPGTVVLYDVRSSRAVAEEIRELGGEPVMCRVGHSHAKKLLRETDGVLGGEFSGHYYFRDNFYCDSGMIATLLLLSVVAREGKPFSRLVGDVKRYHSSGEINFQVEDKQAVLDRLKRDYADGDLNDMDGIRIDYADWWFNARPSNTEPYLRLVVEASSAEQLAARTEELRAKITGG